MERSTFVKGSPQELALDRLLEETLQSWSHLTRAILHQSGSPSDIVFLLRGLYTALTTTRDYTPAESHLAQELEELAEQYPYLVERYSK